MADANAFGLPANFTIPILRFQMIARSLFLVALALLASPALGQQAPLTVERIFTNKEFTADSFSANWMPEGGNYFVKEPVDGGEGNNIVLIDPKTNQRSTLVSAKQMVPVGAKAPIEIESFQVSPDEKKILVFNNTKRVWRRNTRGDYWVIDLATATVKKLGGDKAAESSLMFAKFSPDSKYVAYVRDRNIYAENISTGQISQVTQTETEDIINGTSDWVYEEELSLRDAFQWSEDGNAIVFWRFDTSGVGVFTMINNTDELYPRLIKFQYPKVGTTNSAVSIGIYDFINGETQFVRMPGNPRENYPARIDMIPGTNQFLLQRLNRLQNTNTVSAIDIKTGERRVVFEDKGEAWVEACDWIKWSPDGKHFTFISESDGWQHVYQVNVDNGKKELLTPGDFDVIKLLHIDQKEKRCIFIASPDDPTSRYLYSQSFGETATKRLTPADHSGWHQYSLSADGSSAIHTWSRMDVPPSIETVSLPDHNTIEIKADNQELRDSLAELTELKTEFTRLPIDDGKGGKVMLDTSIIYPPGLNPQDKATKYPVLVYVYSEPAGTTVTDRWDGSKYLWHRMMAEKGYVVMSFDTRGAKCPRGAAWRKSIYKKIGILNPADQAAAVKAALEKMPFLDADRVGIWGWSGGGSSTLNAMFQYPDLYHTGISIAPVPNQLYYDTIYQERYMQTPDLNEAGFRDGSPITHAANLKGNLLLVHGTGDDNCHYQTFELLLNKLIAENKQFKMFAYPNRSHAIREYENTTPHLRSMMTKFLLEHLPVNEKAKR